MTCYDVTMNITPDVQVYKNKETKKPKFEVAAQHDIQGVYETALWMNLHTGTHMDFPKHMLKDGDTSIHFDISRLIRTVKVLDMTHVDAGITKTDLVACQINPHDFLLLKTKNSFTETFDFDFIYLDASGAEYLMSIGVQGVGIDALGIERNQPGYPTHHAFFRHDAIIIEGLRLKEVPQGTYHMLALPMKIDDVEALPLRVLLYEQDQLPFGKK